MGSGMAFSTARLAPPMTESASTPRLRATFAIYLALVGGHDLRGSAGIPADGYYLSGLAGFVFVTLACLGRIWCSLFIAGHKDEVLVTTDPTRSAAIRSIHFPCWARSGLGLTSTSLLLCALGGAARRGAGDLRGILRRAIPRGCVSRGVQGLRRGHA